MKQLIKIFKIKSQKTWKTENFSSNLEKIRIHKTNS